MTSLQQHGEPKNQAESICEHEIQHQLAQIPVCRLQLGLARSFIQRIIPEPFARPPQRAAGREWVISITNYPQDSRKDGFL